MDLINDKIKAILIKYTYTSENFAERLDVDSAASAIDDLIYEEVCKARRECGCGPE